MKIRRTQISIEHRRVTLISTRNLSARGWCSSCERQVRFVSAETAARQAQVSVRSIYRRAETGRIHFTETHDGLLLVCANSIDEPQRQGQLQT